MDFIILYCFLGEYCKEVKFVGIFSLIEWNEKTFHSSRNRRKTETCNLLVFIFPCYCNEIMFEIEIQRQQRNIEQVPIELKYYTLRT